MDKTDDDNHRKALVRKLATARRLHDDNATPGRIAKLKDAEALLRKHDGRVRRKKRAEETKVKEARKERIVSAIPPSQRKGRRQASDFVYNRIVRRDISFVSVVTAMAHRWTTAHPEFPKDLILNPAFLTLHQGDDWNQTAIFGHHLDRLSRTVSTPREETFDATAIPPDHCRSFMDPDVSASADELIASIEAPEHFFTLLNKKQLHFFDWITDDGGLWPPHHTGWARLGYLLRSKGRAYVRDPQRDPVRRAWLQEQEANAHEIIL